MTHQQVDVPLVPADVDLRSTSWMPYFGDYLRGSEFNAKATDAEWRAAHNLWWAAWRQVPAASLPDDDDALARFADLGRDVKAWRKLKAMALHGFTRCSDGRLYHKFLAKEALKAWALRQEGDVERERERFRKQQWREAKRKKRDGAATGNPDDVPPDVPGTSTGQEPGPDADVPSYTIQDRTRQDTTTPLPPPGTGDDPSVVVVDAFLRLRDEMFPNESRLPAVTSTLKTQAKDHLAGDAPVELVVEVIEREMRKLAAAGDEPAPTSLAAFNLSLPAAIRAHRRAAGRSAAAAPRNGRAPEPEFVPTEEPWPQRLRWLQGGKEWRDETWGPPPGAAGCRVPEKFLKEFGHGADA